MIRVPKTKIVPILLFAIVALCLGMAKLPFLDKSKANLTVIVSDSADPIIASISTESGIIGTLVEINGINFTGVTEVTFNNTSSQNVTVESDAKIIAEVPAGATTGKIAVTTAQGTATSTSDFTVILQAEITSVSPQSGEVGTQVTINGNNFTGVTAVIFNKTPATNFTVSSENVINVSVPEGARTGPISVTNAAGTVFTSTDFHVVFIPNIISFTPTTGSEGIEVTLTGDNFNGTTEVSFNNVPTQTFTVVNNSTITAEVPANATSGPIRVTNQDGTAESPQNFTISVAPVISSFSPERGAIGINVTILGSGFTNATEVSFNGKSSTNFSVESDTQIYAEVPEGTSNGPISVTNAVDTGVSANSFLVATDWLKKLADDILVRAPIPSQLPFYNWIITTRMQGMMRAYEATGNQRYYDYIKGWIDTYVDANGNVPLLNNDWEVFEGHMILMLYEITEDPRYLTAALNLYNNLINTAIRSSDGGFSHRLAEVQLWDDTLNGLLVFLAKLGSVTGDSLYLNEGVQQILVHAQHLQDQASGLWYHAWDEDGNATWADPLTYRSPEYWSRGVSWVVMAVPDFLDYLPENYPGHDEIITMLQGLIQGLLNVQQNQSGLWLTVLDKPGQPGNFQETSGSAIITYGLARAIFRGYVSNLFQVNLDNAELGLENEIFENGQGVIVNNVSEGTNIGDYTYYVSRQLGTGIDYPYGDGAFLLAQAAIRKMTIQPAQLSIVSGNNQIGQSDTFLAESIKIRALTADGQPVSDVKIKFEILNGGGSHLRFDEMITSGDGTAWTKWKLGDGVGEQQLRVTSSQLNSVTFTATNDSNNPHSLAVSVNPNGGGTVTIDPQKVSYSDGEIVNLQAVPNAGFQFSNWSGDVTGNTNPITLTMNSDKQVTAAFIDAGATNNLSVRVEVDPYDQWESFTFRAFNNSDLASITSIIIRAVDNQTFDVFHPGSFYTVQPNVGGNNDNNSAAELTLLFGAGFNPGSSDSNGLGSDLDWETKQLDVEVYFNDGRVLAGPMLNVGDSDDGNNDLWLFEAGSSVPPSEDEHILTVLVSPFSPQLKRIMLLGNSITKGVSGPSTDDAGYRNDLHDLLNNAGISFDFVGTLSDGVGFDNDHEGHDGWRAVQILANINTYLFAQPDVVVIHLGTNDISNGDTPESARDDIGAIIDAIKNNNPNTQIILSSMIPRTDVTNDVGTTTLNALLADLYQTKLAAGFNIFFADANGQFKSNANWESDYFVAPDFVHPNDLGFNVMARLYFDVLVIACASGGEVAVNPNKTSYSFGETVELTAIASDGYTFDNWTGDIDGVNNSSVLINFIMDRDRTVTANFSATLQSQHSLSVSVNPSGGGTVSINPDNAIYSDGENVNLFAIPNTGFQFSNWSGDAGGSNASLDLIMNQDLQVTANFESVPGPIENVTFTKHVIDSNLGGAFWVTMQDVNRDGRLDLLTSSGNGLDWWENNGSGSFNQHFVGLMQNSWSVFADDFDGDGDIDILGGSNLVKEIAVFENVGSENFQKRLVQSGYEDPESLYARDFDGDGDMDILSCAVIPGTVDWWEKSGNNYTHHLIDGDLPRAHSIYPADLDNDGDIDVIAGGSGTSYWYENDGSGNFSRISLGGGGLSFFAADLDNDGDLDILRTQRENGDLDWFENDGGNFIERNIEAGYGDSWSAIPGDIDGDGDLDIAAAGFAPNSIKVWFNLGGGNFDQGVVIDNVSDPRYVYIGDLDNDGDGDIAAAIAGEGQLVWYEVQGTPVSSKTITIVTPNGGEILLVDSNYNIAWTSSGNVGNVKIDYSIDNGVNWNTIVSGTENDGTYDWTTPNAASEFYFIRISEAATGDPTDLSNNRFQIEAEPLPIPTITSFDPGSGAFGSEVTILGLNFSDATTLAFNSVDASFSIISDTEILATVPNDATTGKIAVTNAAGTGESELAFVVPITLPPGALDAAGTKWAPYLEWDLQNPSFSGNPFDLVASATFTHLNSGETITTGMFYAGADTWKFRFTGRKTGNWVFTTSSTDPDLNGHSGTVTIDPNPNPEVAGFVTNYGNKWGRSGLDEAFVPQFVMYASPHEYYNNPDKIDADIQTFMIEHGFNGFHTMVFCRWFDLDQPSYENINIPDPDFRTFEALELLITKVHEAGGVVHIWAWGDESRKYTPNKWGKNGAVDQRLQRYIAARLGPIPGWTMGYGFDLAEWVVQEDLREWHDYMQGQMGYFHFLGGRTFSPVGEFNQIYEGFDYSGYGQAKPDYNEYVSTVNARPIKPSFSEQRFRIRNLGIEDDYTMEEVRRGLWNSYIAGGVANIWGNLTSQATEISLGLAPSLPFPNPEWIKTNSEFFKARFSKDLEIDNSITDGVCLKRPASTHYLFYKEDAASIQMDLSGMSGAQQAVAVDAKLAYSEISLGSLSNSNQTWTAPYQSDWAIAVGNFGSNPASTIVSSSTSTEVTHEETQTGSSSASEKVSTSSLVTAAKQNLYLAAVSTSPKAELLTVQGMGLEWRRLKAQCAGSEKSIIEVWMGYGVPTKHEIVTAKVQKIVEHATIVVSRYSGVDNLNPIGTIVSANTNGKLGSCSDGKATDLYSFHFEPTTKNALIYSASTLMNQTHTPGKKYVELAEIFEGVVGSVTGIAVQEHRMTSESSVKLEGRFSGEINWAVVGLEIRPLNAVSISQANSEEIQGEEIERSETEENDSLLPEEITLSQNYPNPFNAETNIKFTLPTPAKVRLVIFNAKGQEVRKLIDRNLTAGFKTEKWDGRDDRGIEVSSAVYFVRLEIGHTRLIRKMIMQK